MVTVGKLNVTHFLSEDIERDEQTLPLSPTPPLQDTTGSTGNNPKPVTSESDLTAPAAYKRILIVDDDPDITLTFKSALEGYYHDDDKRFEVYTYNNPLVALSEFKPHFYDLLLTDIHLPDMNGFQFSQKILELDINVRVCFTTAGEVNIEALREIHPMINFGCFIKKPVSIDYLVKRLSAELD